MKMYAIMLFFEDSEFPQASQEVETFPESVENSVRRTFLNADLALADDLAVSRSLETRTLTNQNVPKRIIFLKDTRFLMATGFRCSSLHEKACDKVVLEDSEFPRASQEDETFSETTENSIRKAFLNAYIALADASAISRS